MILKITIGNWRFTFSMAPITRVVGVNSLLPDGQHILMWDFDETNFWQVHDALLETQRVYQLPNIYILETKKDTNYQAYCFKAVPWRKAVEIIAFTKGVDWNYFKYGVFRGKFTLRVSPKCGRKPKLVHILKSDIPEDVFIHDLRDWVEYETLADNANQRKIELTLPPKRKRR